MNEINIKKLTDDDGHWYWIPVELVDEFNYRLYLISGKDYMDRPDEFDLFEYKFDKYRTGGDPDLTPQIFEP